MPNYTGNKGIRYCGSKGKQAKYIVPIVNALTRDRGTFWEPFVGAGKIVQSVKAAKRYGSDTCHDIVVLLRAVRDGWNPPNTVSEEEYVHWMTRRGEATEDPMRGFVLFGCSFGARYGQGYARSKKGYVNFASSARVALLRQRPLLQGIELRIRDYRKGFWRDPMPNVVYADPPYSDTKPVGSGVSKAFDSAEFWKIAAEWAKSSIVLVSEYSCPLPQATVLWESKVAAGIRFGTGGRGGDKGSGQKKHEKLFSLNEGTGGAIGLGLY